MNPATFKDGCPINVADLLVNTAAKYDIFLFIDGHSKYNHNFIGEENVHSTAFKLTRTKHIKKYVNFSYHK